MFNTGVIRSAKGAARTAGPSQEPIAPRSVLRGVIRSGVLFCMLATPMLYAADFSSYRGLHFGMDLAAAAAQAGSGAKLTDARVVHQRPALIQELDWRPRPLVVGETVSADPVKDGVLSFFNGELYRIVVNYDRYRVEGMTAEDMIKGVSATYGTPTKPGVEIPYHSNYGEVASVIARWEDPEYAVDLVRTGDRSSFSLVLYSKSQETLAKAAIVEAVRLETQEAPQREIDRQKKRDDDDKLLLEKARTANVPNFQP
jgi:hypothetical protein